MTLPADHPPVTRPRLGVLLVNLGTPDAPTPAAVRRYLKEFLWDRRVVEIPRAVWWPVLNLIILNTRPKKSAHAYAQVWGPDGSPLAAITKAQAAALQDRLGDAALVRWAMRYGNPALGSELQALKDAGCDRILVAPLYPQYSGATTASAMDALAAQLGAMRWQPALRTLPPYYDDPAHIEQIWHKIFRSFTYMGSRGAAVECVSAIDIALWDIRGKALGLPCWKLMGGARKPHITPYASLLPTGHTVTEYRDSLAAKAREAARLGFRATMIEMTRELGETPRSR